MQILFLAPRSFQISAAPLQRNDMPSIFESEDAIICPLRLHLFPWQGGGMLIVYCIFSLPKNSLFMFLPIAHGYLEKLRLSEKHAHAIPRPDNAPSSRRISYARPEGDSPSIPRTRRPLASTISTDVVAAGTDAEIVSGVISTGRNPVSSVSLSPRRRNSARHW